MKRPILIITLGTIVGILGGLLGKIVPLLFFIIFLFVLFLKKVKIKYRKNFFDAIIKLWIKNNTILLLLGVAFVASIGIRIYEARYGRIYQHFEKKKIVATVISDEKETNYYFAYKVKWEEDASICFLVYFPKNIKTKITYGDKIEIKGEYKPPEVARNPGGFHYRNYLKTKKIYGIFQAEQVKVVEKNCLNIIELSSHRAKRKIIDCASHLLSEDTRQMCLGILIGYDDELQVDITENFRKSGLSHVLAVSGMHIGYLAMGLDYFGIGCKISKKIRNLGISCILIFFLYIANFSPSVVRASIMMIIVFFSFLLERKSDTLTSMCFSLLIILLYNPYQLFDIGLLLSYLATIGIIYFSKVFVYFNEKQQVRWREKLKNIVKISAYANIVTAPIIVYSFHTFSINFFLSGFLSLVFMGPIILGGFGLIILSLISFSFAASLAKIYELLLNIFITCTKRVGCLPFAEIIVPTPSIISVIFYYDCILAFLLYRWIKKNVPNRYLVKKIAKRLDDTKAVLKKHNRIIFFLLTFFILFMLVLNRIPKNLKIYFVDVGQGDSTLVITPTGKTIMIDSGGSETGNFDVGKNTLMPYLLYKKITVLDYICISHFDTDHCQGFIYLLNHIKIKNLVISKQYESTRNFEEITEVARKKKIKIIVISAGDRLKIDSYVHFKIFHPSNSLNTDINDNSIVMKLEYNQFSCLFTGDISQKMEEQLVKDFRKELKSTILKVAHHGSKTSSKEEFLEVVQPQIALIGVGKNNKFGHPSEEVLGRFKRYGIKIYRTDQMGEISISVDSYGKIKIKRWIQ